MIRKFDIDEISSFFFDNDNCEVFDTVKILTCILNEKCDISDADNTSTRVTKNENSMEYEDNVCKIALRGEKKFLPPNNAVAINVQNDILS